MAEFPCVALPNTEVRTLKSTVADQVYQLYIGLPYNYATVQKALPVLYLLDANIGFGVLEFLRMLQHVHEVPDFLLVGIGYPVYHFMETLELRQRDYTPTVDQKMAAQTASTQPGSEPYEMGGAATFLQFFQAELLPFMMTNYRIDATDRGIVGVSLGGLFALYTLFHQPDLFSRYIIISPSLWWDNQVVFAYEDKLATTRNELKARVFMSAGSLESEDIKDNVIRLAERLCQRNYDGFQLKVQILEGETHVSGVSSAICKGVRAVYGGGDSDVS